MRDWQLSVTQAVVQADAATYVYDLDGFGRHIECLNHSNLSLYLAVKANPASPFLKAAHDRGWGLDVASIGELQHVLNVGIPAESVLMTGPARSKRDWALAVALGVRRFVVESPSQLDILGKVARGKPEVLLRLQMKSNPQYQGDNVLGGGHSVFGSTMDAWTEIIPSRYIQLNICGVHVFQWGNVMDEDRLISIWQRSAHQAQKLMDQLGLPLRLLDLGGGLGIPYQDQNQSLSWTRLLPALCALKSRGIETLLIEMGRYALGPYGYYGARILDIKWRYGVRYLVLEGGINHMVRPALTSQAFPCLQAMASGPPTRVHGPLCSALDHLGTYCLPADLAIGDVLVFAQAGAYGFTESMPFFLAHPLPAERVMSRAGDYWLRRGAPPSSWLR